MYILFIIYIIYVCITYIIYIVLLSTVMCIQQAQSKSLESGCGSGCESNCKTCMCRVTKYRWEKDKCWKDVVIIYQNAVTDSLGKNTGKPVQEMVPGCCVFIRLLEL